MKVFVSREHINNYYELIECMDGINTIMDCNDMINFYDLCQKYHNIKGKYDKELVGLKFINALDDIIPSILNDFFHGVRNKPSKDKSTRNDLELIFPMYGLNDTIQTMADLITLINENTEYSEIDTAFLLEKEIIRIENNNLDELKSLVGEDEAVFDIIFIHVHYNNIKEIMNNPDDGSIPQDLKDRLSFLINTYDSISNTAKAVDTLIRG